MESSQSQSFGLPYQSYSPRGLSHTLGQTETEASNRTKTKRKYSLPTKELGDVAEKARLSMRSAAGSIQNSLAKTAEIKNKKFEKINIEDLKKILISFTSRQNTSFLISKIAQKINVHNIAIAALGLGVVTISTAALAGCIITGVPVAIALTAAAGIAVVGAAVMFSYELHHLYQQKVEVDTTSSEIIEMIKKKLDPPLAIEDHQKFIMEGLQKEVEVYQQLQKNEKFTDEGEKKALEGIIHRKMNFIKGLSKAAKDKEEIRRNIDSLDKNKENYKEELNKLNKSLIHINRAFIDMLNIPLMKMADEKKFEKEFSSLIDSKKNKSNKEIEEKVKILFYLYTKNKKPELEDHKKQIKTEIPKIKQKIHSIDQKITALEKAIEHYNAQTLTKEQVGSLPDEQAAYIPEQANRSTTQQQASSSLPDNMMKEMKNEKEKLNQHLNKLEQELNSIGRFLDDLKNNSPKDKEMLKMKEGSTSLSIRQNEQMIRA